MASRLTRLTRLTRPFATLPSSLQTHHPIRYASSSKPTPPNPFESMPSPLRLPPDQQAEFERLQRTANTQEGFQPDLHPGLQLPGNSRLLLLRGRRAYGRDAGD